MVWLYSEAVGYSNIDFTFSLDTHIETVIPSDSQSAGAVFTVSGILPYHLSVIYNGESVKVIEQGPDSASFMILDLVEGEAFELYNDGVLISCDLCIPTLNEDLQPDFVVLSETSADGNLSIFYDTNIDVSGFSATFLVN